MVVDEGTAGTVVYGISAGNVGDVPRPLTHFMDVVEYDDWKETLVHEFKVDKSVLSNGIGINLQSRIHERGTIAKLEGIYPPAFDPTCIGKPILWCDHGKNSYRPVLSWGKSTKQYFDETAKGEKHPDFGLVELAGHVRDFLAVHQSGEINKVQQLET